MKYQFLLLVLIVSICGHEAKNCHHKHHQNDDGQKFYQRNPEYQNLDNGNFDGQNGHFDGRYGNFDGHNGNFDGHNGVDGRYGNFYDQESKDVFLNLNQQNFRSRLNGRNSNRHPFIPSYKWNRWPQVSNEQWSKVSNGQWPQVSNEQWPKVSNGQWPEEQYKNEHIWTPGVQERTPIVVKSLSYRPEPEDDYHVRVAHEQMGHPVLYQNHDVHSHNVHSHNVQSHGHHHHGHKRQKMFTMRCKLVKVQVTDSSLDVQSTTDTHYPTMANYNGANYNEIEDGANYNSQSDDDQNKHQKEFTLRCRLMKKHHGHKSHVDDHKYRNLEEHKYRNLEEHKYRNLEEHKYRNLEEHKYRNLEEHRYQSPEEHKYQSPKEHKYQSPKEHKYQSPEEHVVRIHSNQWISPIQTQILADGNLIGQAFHPNEIPVHVQSYVHRTSAHAHPLVHHLRPKRQTESEETAPSTEGGQHGGMGAGASVPGMGAGAGMSGMGAGASVPGMGAGAGMSGMGAGASMPGMGAGAGAGMSGMGAGASMPGMGAGAAPPDYSKIGQQWKQGIRRIGEQFKKAQQVFRTSWSKIKDIFSKGKTTDGATGGNSMAGGGLNDAQSIPPV